MLACLLRWVCQVVALAARKGRTVQVTGRTATTGTQPVQPVAVGVVVEAAHGDVLLVLLALPGVAQRGGRWVIVEQQRDARRVLPAEQRRPGPAPGKDTVTIEAVFSADLLHVERQVIVDRGPLLPAIPAAATVIEWHWPGPSCRNRWQSGIALKTVAFEYALCCTSLAIACTSLDESCYTCR